MVSPSSSDSDRSDSGRRLRGLLALALAVAIGWLRPLASAAGAAAPAGPPGRSDHARRRRPAGAGRRPARAGHARGGIRGQRHGGRGLRVQLRAAVRARLPALARRRGQSGCWRRRSSARADVQAASHLTLFTEPSRARTEGMRVIHPQTEVAASHGALGIQAGYELDIVSGATTRVYRPGRPPDAVSGATFSDLRHAARGALSFETASVALQRRLFLRLGERLQVAHPLGRGARGLPRAQLHPGPRLHAELRQRSAIRPTAWPRACSTCGRCATSDGCFQADQPELTTRRLSIDTFEPALSWTATPLLLLQLGATLQILDGFQSNPYRAVRLGARGARAAGAAAPVPPALRPVPARPPGDPAAAGGGAAGRPGLPGHLGRDGGARPTPSGCSTSGPSLMAGVRGRYHRQTGAIFFRTADELPHASGPPANTGPAIGSWRR